MAYSPAAHNTATAGRAGFVRLGSGVSGNSDGSIVSNATLLGLTANSVGLGNVTNESKATMFTKPTFTGTATVAKFYGVSVGSYGTALEDNSDDVSVGHGFKYASGNNTMSLTSILNATRLVQGVGQQGQSKYFAFQRSATQNAGNISWTNLLYIDSSDDLYAKGNIYANGSNQVAILQPDWTSWTPTTSGLGATPGAGVTSAVYMRIANIVFFNVTLVTDNASAGNFSLPVAPASGTGNTGNWIYKTSSNPYPAAHGAWYISGGNTTCYFGPLSASGMGAGEIFVFSGSYRV
jgi:hypothetical protein